jgi:hypothetical protein
MAKSKLFRTYIVTFPSHAVQINETGIEGEWQIKTQDDPSLRHWSWPDERGWATFFGEQDNKEIRKYRKNFIPAKEILIETGNEDAATNVASLIQTGILLGYPEISNGPKYFGADTAVKKIEKFMKGKPFCERFSFQENTVYGCKIAIAAWAEQSLRYAIEKYRLSLGLDSITPNSAAPRRGQVFLNQYPDYSYHVSAATALLVAFSIIEELGLEIRSSAKKPRFINSTWNPVVKSDAEKRLRKRGVDLAESVLWIYRGRPSKLELSIEPKLGVQAEYADGKIVRDREMEVIDAIHQASYIRNYIIAHKYSELVTELGPYDIHNVQLLARRLILSSLGLYKIPNPNSFG